MEQDSSQSICESEQKQEVYEREEKQQCQGDEKRFEGMSKSQWKKLIKKEKWEKEKLKRRQQKRQKERQKKKEKKQQQKEQKQPEEKNKLEEQHEQHLNMRKRKEDYVQKMKEGVPVVIDLQFYDKMTQKQQNSLIRQLSHCHSSNRKSEKAFNYILTSVTKQRKEELSKKYNVDKWGIAIHQESILQVFGPEKLVYLTGDAQEDVDILDPKLVYVIGGIVDHNRLKKITYDYAKEKGVAVRRLPMHHVKLKASVHLAVNHVWEWMLKAYNGASWDDALKSVLPLRKLETYTEQ